MRLDLTTWLSAFVLLAPASIAQAAPCCGPITETGRRLSEFLDASGVDHLWVAGWHVNWRTGETDRSKPGGKSAATHCSAFAAAMALRLGVYLLRPPEHAQELLANAQLAWLRDEVPLSGWRRLVSYVEAQEQANAGALVLAAFQNPDPHKPGHIAIVRPSEKARRELDRDGPQETQAGETNSISTTIAAGFRHHPGAWLPHGQGSMRYFAHDVDWSKVTTRTAP